jgi:hypothetical protein
MGCKPRHGREDETQAVGTYGHRERSNAPEERTGGRMVESAVADELEALQNFKDSAIDFIRCLHPRVYLAEDALTVIKVSDEVVVMGNIVDKEFITAIVQEIPEVLS